MSASNPLWSYLLVGLAGPVATAAIGLVAWWSGAFDRINKRWQTIAELYERVRKQDEIIDGLRRQIDIMTQRWANVQRTVHRLGASVTQDGQVYAERGPRVLVLEDDEDYREILVGALKVAGYLVLAAANAEQAMGVISTADITIAVLDFYIGGKLTAKPVVAALRQANPHCQIIFLTGARDRQASADMAALDPMKILTKPVDLDIVIREIKTAEGKSQVTPPAVTEGATTP